MYGPVKTLVEQMGRIDRVAEKKWATHRAENALEKHSESCTYCNGAFYSTIVTGATGCIAGVKLALKVRLAYKAQ